MTGGPTTLPGPVAEHAASPVASWPARPSAAVVEALLDLARAFPSGTARLSPELLEETLHQAGRHGLAPVVAEMLRRSGELEGASVQVSRTAMLAAAKTMRVKRLLLKSLDALRARGLVPILLKGYALGARLYGAPLLRPTSDVDLLLLPRDIPVADEGLRALGLTPLSEETSAYRLEHHHHLNYSGQEGLVELHFRALTCFGAQLAAEPLWGRSFHGELEGRPVRYLSAEDEVLYLAAHAANHLLQRLGWLLDIKLLIEAEPRLDWSALVARARECGMSTPIFFALQAAAEVLGAAVPERSLESLRPFGWQRRLGARLFSDRFLVWAPFEEHKYLTHLLTTLLSTTPSHMARYTLQHTQHAAKRRVARALPGLAPERWKG